MAKIITWNVNSVNSRLERLLKLLERHQPDFLCLQELKCLEEKFPFAALDKTGYFCTTYGQKTYNGVAILSREKPLEITRGFGDGVEDSAARFVFCRFSKLSLGSVYVPNGKAVGNPSYDYKLLWLERLRKYLDAHCQTVENLVLGGDFNVAPEDRDVYDPDGWRDQVLVSEPERQALKRVMEFGLHDTFRRQHPESGRYSWWDYRQLAFPFNKGLRIDLLLASQALADKCKTTDIDRQERTGEKPSDHAPCLADFDLN